jgi:hypothetical protein
MATTTNYGWATPDNTDLVKDGALAIRTLGSAVDATVFANAGAGIAKTIVDAKGDIIAATAADTVARLAVGANDTVLTADSTTATGLKWAAAAGGSSALTLISTATFSSVSSQTMDSVFSSTYDNYIVKVNCTASTQATLEYYLRSGGSDTTTNYQRQILILAGASITGDRNATNGIGVLTTGGKNFTMIEIFDPNKANYTGVITSSIREDSGDLTTAYFASYQKSNTAYTGIKFLTSAGTMTGSISIYGLAK